MKAIRLSAYGGPEVMVCEEVRTRLPGPHEVLVRITAAGVNYIDICQRAGFSPVPLPLTLGVEGAGIVETVGEEVVGLSPGDRIVYAGVPAAYAEFATIPAAQAVVVPEGLDLEEAASVMVQGLMAHSLATSVYPLRAGDTCLVHAAAGGVGRILCQIARLRGAAVIGTVSREEKIGPAREAGASEVVVTTREDLAAAVRRITGGVGVRVVYDSVGAETFLQGLDCLAPRGMMVLFGEASGRVDPLDPQLLCRKGSLHLTRPNLAHYIATPEELRSRAGDLFGWVLDGSLSLRVHARFPLAAAADAHRQLESRRTSGKLLLIP